MIVDHYLWMGMARAGTRMLALVQPNAGPEWQAMNLRWSGEELVVAFPLKGLVRSAQIRSVLVNSFLVAEI